MEKDNFKKLWFKRKTYGWGWTPATWQGWLMTFIYVGFIFAVFLITGEDVNENPDSGSNLLIKGLPIVIFTILFIFVAYKKGEKPKWQWGLPKDK